VIDIVVDSRVRVLPSPGAAEFRIMPELEALVVEHTHRNPDYAKARHLGFKKRVPKFIVTSRDFRSGEEGISFPRGSERKVREQLGALWMRARDERTLGDRTLGRIPEHHPPSGALWPHQRMLVDRAAAAETALVRSATASGKTCAALALAARLDLPTLVVVHNSNLFKQWIDRCVSELRVPRDWVGQIQGSKRRLGPITVGMQQTLCGCAAEVAPAFGLVIVDEVHRSAARTFLEVVDAMTAKYRVGVSDDERRSDGKEFLIYDMFGPVVGEASHDDLVEHGYVMDVRVRVVPTGFRADWYVGLEDREKVLAYDQLLAAMASDATRNRIAVRDVPRDALSGHQVIVFTHRVEHAYALDRELNGRGTRSGFVVGEQPAESDRTLDRFRRGEVSVVVGTYQALGTGVDMPRATRGVLATPIANNQKGHQQFKQYRGRFARAADGKAEPEVTYLWDAHVFGARPLRHLCRWARDVRVEWNGRYVPGKEVLKEFEGRALE
jgi:superfamily II DNA or RNA helicase